MLVADSLRIAANAGAFRKLAGFSDVPINNGLAQEILGWERGYVEHLAHVAERRAGEAKVAAREARLGAAMPDEEELKLKRNGDAGERRPVRRQAGGQVAGEGGYAVRRPEEAEGRRGRGEPPGQADGLDHGEGVGADMKANKKGRIVVDYRFLKEHPEAVLRLFAEIGFLPIRVNHDMFCDTTEYAGYSESFRETADGELAPVYRVLCEAGENNEIVRVWVEETKE